MEDSHTITHLLSFFLERHAHAANEAPKFGKKALGMVEDLLAARLVLQDTLDESVRRSLEL